MLPAILALVLLVSSAQLAPLALVLVPPLALLQAVPLVLALLLPEPPVPDQLVPVLVLTLALVLVQHRSLAQALLESIHPLLQHLHLRGLARYCFEMHRPAQAAVCCGKGSISRS